MAETTTLSPASWKCERAGEHFARTEQGDYLITRNSADGLWWGYFTGSNGSRSASVCSGQPTMRDAKRWIEEDRAARAGTTPAAEAPKAKPAKLSPKMASALKLIASTEPGNDTLNEGAGIMPSWMVATSTHAALIHRGMLTPQRMVYGGERDDQGCPVRAFGPLVQITAAGCEAIGRSMDEIVAWAWDQAMDEYEAQSWFVSSATIMKTLPVEVGAVVGWTHRGEPMTGEVRSIFGDALSVWVPSSSTTGYEWTVTLDQIERVTKLARPGIPEARIAALLEHIDRGYDAANIVHGMDEVTCLGGHVAAPRTLGGTCAECEQPSETPDLRAGMSADEANDMAALEYLHRELHADDTDTGRRVYIRDGMHDQKLIARGYALASAAHNPEFPKGTPEHAAYTAELKTELAKFAKGEEPYPFGGPEGCRREPRKVTISGYATPVGRLPFRKLIEHYGNARHDVRREARDAFAEIERRLNLAAALMPAEVRQILDGHVTVVDEQPTCAVCGTAVKRNGRKELLHADYMETAHDHAAVVVDEKPSVFANGAPVRTHSDGSMGGVNGDPLPWHAQAIVDALDERTARDDALQADLSTGRADRKALPIVPSVKPPTVAELLDSLSAAAIKADRFRNHDVGPALIRERDGLRAEIERRLNQILDGHRS